MIWFGWVLWHINHCRLFNARSSLDISNMICEHILWITFLNKPKFSFILFYLRTGKWFQILRECPRGVMVKAMNCGVVVSGFVLQSRYYVYFRANTLRKGMKPLILPAMG